MATAAVSRKFNVACVTTFEADVQINAYYEDEEGNKHDIVIKPTFFDYETDKPLTVQPGTEYTLILAERQTLVRVAVDTTVDPASGGSFKPAWPVMTFFARSDGPSCTVDLPMVKVEPQTQMAKVVMHLYECDHDCGGHERRKPLDAGVSVYKVQLCGPPEFEQHKQARHGCVAFSVPSGNWYTIKVNGHNARAGASVNFFACADEPAEFPICCRPAKERTLKVTFQDDYCQPVQDVNFRMDGVDYCANKDGEYYITNPRVGKHIIEPAGVLKFKPFDITIGTAEEQSVHVPVQAQAPASTPNYSLTFEVEDFTRVTEEVRIVVLDPATRAMMCELPVDQYGAAQCNVDQNVPHEVMLKIGDQIVQRAHVKPHVAGSLTSKN